MYNKLKCNSYRRKIMKLTEQRLKRMIKQVLKEEMGHFDKDYMEECLLAVLSSVKQGHFIRLLNEICPTNPDACEHLIRLLEPHAQPRLRR